MCERRKRTRKTENKDRIIKNKNPLKWRVLWLLKAFLPSRAEAEFKNGLRKIAHIGVYIFFGKVRDWLKDSSVEHLVELRVSRILGSNEKKCLLPIV